MRRGSGFIFIDSPSEDCQTPLDRPMLEVSNTFLRGLLGGFFVGNLRVHGSTVEQGVDGFLIYWPLRIFH